MIQDQIQDAPVVVEAPPAPQMPDMPPPPDGVPVFVQTASEPSFSEIAPVIAIFVIMVGALILLFPLVRAWARRIEGGAATRELRSELDELRARLADVEQHQLRVSDVEERLDFAERLLTQRAAPRLEDR